MAKIVEVYYVHYDSPVLKTRGIVIFDTQKDAEKYIKQLEKWEDTFQCMKITGPHEHEVVT